VVEPADIRGRHVNRAQIYRVIFILAGAYNILVGLWAALAPRALFLALDLGPPSHPAVWACLGMVIGLYGLVYLQVAFTDPARRSSVVIVFGRRVEYDVTRFLIGIGLAGKILGPIGFVLAVQRGELPLRMMPLVALDDLIWWAPFALYLLDGTRMADALARQAPRICAAIHVVAAGATLAWIRGGSEAESDPAARAAFIAAHALTWRAAWFIWMIAAISLGGFFCWWAARSPKPHLARTALVIGCAGIFADFFSDALFIGWLPERYASLAPFTTFVSEVVANGLYSIAGAILMLASPPMRPGFRAWGWIVWLAGFALAAAGATRWDAAIVVSSGVLLGVFICWVSVADRFLGES
jgi:hypothetical protein